jgi:hypothetical protein
MLYDHFDSNANLDLHSQRMMHGKTVSWDGPGNLSAHADMDDFLDIPILFSLCCPRIVDSTRSAHDAVLEGFMAISNLLDIDSISEIPISNLDMFDPPRRAPPLGLPLNRSSDLGNAIFAATRGPTRLDKDCSLSFANSYLTSVHVNPARRN